MYINKIIYTNYMYQALACTIYTSSTSTYIADLLASHGSNRVVEEASSWWGTGEGAPEFLFILVSSSYCEERFGSISESSYNFKPDRQQNNKKNENLRHRTLPHIILHNWTMYAVYAFIPDSLWMLFECPLQSRMLMGEERHNGLESSWPRPDCCRLR